MIKLFYGIKSRVQIKNTLLFLLMSLAITACTEKSEPAKQNSGQLNSQTRSKTEVTQDSRWVNKAKQVTTQYKLTSLAIKCLAFDDGGTVNGKKKITVREVHNEKCGGDPETAPRIFSFEVDVATGKFKTDRYSVISGGGFESLDNLSKLQE